jgi:poly(3-hydroxybutyrate) depolymerase
LLNASWRSIDHCAAPSVRLAARLLHLDQPSSALNATQVIWQFFASHHRAAHPR